LSNWKRDFLSGAEQVFDKGSKSPKTEAEEEKDKLLKTIGKLKVEVDFLKDALR
jgi:transposase